MAGKRPEVSKRKETNDSVQKKETNWNRNSLVHMAEENARINKESGMQSDSERIKNIQEQLKALGQSKNTSGDQQIAQKIDRMKQAGDNGKTPIGEFIDATKKLWGWCEKQCVKHTANTEKWNSYNDIANQFQAIHENSILLDNAQGNDAIRIYKTIDLRVSDYSKLYYNRDIIQILQSKWETLKLQSDQATSQDIVQRVQDTEVIASSSGTSTRDIQQHNNENVASSSIGPDQAGITKTLILDGNNKNSRGLIIESGKRSNFGDMSKEGVYLINKKANIDQVIHLPPISDLFKLKWNQQVRDMTEIGSYSTLMNMVKFGQSNKDWDVVIKK